ncbi:hypothetical protein BYT27DRAFT_7197720 [Phlegmacium glaucopus]|nr:hypothetical protein BYT27DRAFT_7197720 [Phlegmacium glaucopus]
MLCPLSGLNPLGGPITLVGNEDIGTTVPTEMASEVISWDLASIILNALEMTLPPPEDRGIQDALKLPDGVLDWEYFHPIAIEHFDEDGVCPVDERSRYPSGRDVQIRRLTEYYGHGGFLAYFVEDEGGGERTVEEATWCSPGCSLFVLQGCLEYLRVWLDPSLPQRVAFMDSTPSMSLDGELYEILNSRHQRRGCPTQLLPSIQYGDIPKTWDQDQWNYLKAPIRAGLRGKELLPALYGDFQCWLSMRPDIWPSPNASSTPTFTQPSLTSGLSGRFLQLPTEIRLEILRELPIRNILALSSASRSLRASITEPAFLNQVIKEAMLRGSAFWILPVAAIPGEMERAWEVANQWLVMASSNRAREVQPRKSPFNSPSFPFACYGSDSMRNRQRFWNIAKQFDGIWRDYRLNGWQRDIFTSYGEAPLDTSNRKFVAN